MQLTKSFVGLVFTVFSLFLVAYALLAGKVPSPVFYYSLLAIVLYLVAVYHFRLQK